jgi:hypothetical protein
VHHERWNQLHRLLGNRKGKNEQANLVVHETKKLLKIIDWQEIKQKPGWARQTKRKNYDAIE